MIIYVIENKMNGKKYVGKTTRTLDKRLKEHKKTNSLIGEAIQEFGINNFTIKEIEKVDTKKELRKKEIEYIEKLNTVYPKGYNKCIDDYILQLTKINDTRRFYIKKYNKKK